MINFARPILRLPLNLVGLCFHYPHKMYRFKDLFHHHQVPFYFTICRSFVFVDATPGYIGMWDHGGRRGHVFRCQLPILEAEYAAAWLAHILYNGGVIFSDNQAVIHLFAKGGKASPGLARIFQKNRYSVAEFSVSRSHLHSYILQPGGSLLPSLPPVNTRFGNFVNSFSSLFF